MSKTRKQLVAETSSGAKISTKIREATTEEELQQALKEAEEHVKTHGDRWQHQFDEHARIQRGKIELKRRARYGS